jgi:phosphinothricin acetyltransferase
MHVTVERMTRADWPSVQEIYRAGLESGEASFETIVPDWESWDAKYLADFRFVARDDGGDVVGWAGLTRVSMRRVYVGVAEVSVYVAPSAQRRGVGERLLRALIDASEGEGIWTLQSGIFPENAASIALHRKCGFREVGRRERLGKHRDVWRDSLLFERRSNVAGID